MKPEDLNLEFWKEVEKEYLASSLPCSFICNGSPTFAKAWDYFETSQEIQRLARDFQISKGFKPDTGFHGSLFYSTSRQLRLEFIDWNIQRLSN